MLSIMRVNIDKERSSIWMDMENVIVVRDLELMNALHRQNVWRFTKDHILNRK